MSVAATGPSAGLAASAPLLTAEEAPGAKTAAQKEFAARLRQAALEEVAIEAQITPDDNRVVVEVDDALPRAVDEDARSVPDADLDTSLDGRTNETNDYLTSLPGLIARGMGDRSPSDAIQLLSEAVSDASNDPQFATEIVSASANQLRAALEQLSSAGTDQADPAYASVATIHNALGQAARFGVPDAVELAGHLAEWSPASLSLPPVEALAPVGTSGSTKPDDAATKKEVSFEAFMAGLAQKPQTPATPGTKRFLFVLAHPDDDVNAYGAIRSALAQGAKIDVVYLTSSEGGAMNDNENGLPVERKDEWGEVDVDPRNGARRIKEMLDFYEKLGAGDNVTVTVLDGNPDFNIFLNPDWWGVRYAQAAQWKTEATLQVLSGMLKANNYDAIVAMSDDPQVHPAHQESFKLSVEAADIFAAETKKGKPAIFGIRETGWYRSDQLRPLPPEGGLITFGSSALNGKKQILIDTYKSQQPGYPDFFDFLRDHEILLAAEGTTPEQVEALQLFFEEGTRRAADNPQQQSVSSTWSKEYTSVKLIDNVEKKDERAEGAETPRQAWKPSTDGQRSATELSAEIALAAATGTVVDYNPGTTDDEKRAYHVAQEARRMYLLQAGPKYTPPPRLRDRVGFILGPDGGFFRGPDMQVVLYVTTSRDFADVSKHGLTVVDDMHIGIDREEAHRDAAARVGQNPGKPCFVYRIAGKAGDLSAVPGAEIRAETIEGGVAVINKGGAIHPESWMNKAFASETGELHGEPYKVPMTAGEKAGAAVKTGATMVAAGVGAVALTRLGGAPHYAQIMGELTEVGLGAFGLRALSGFVATRHQTKVAEQLDVVKNGIRAGRELRRRPVMSPVDIINLTDPGERKEALAKALVDQDFHFQNQPLVNALPENLNKLKKMLTAHGGVLRGVNKHDRDAFRLQIEMLEHRTKSNETFESLDRAQLLSPESGAAILKEIIEAASYGFNHAAGSRLLLNIWLDPKGDIFAHFSHNLAGAATVDAYASAGIFAPIHLMVNASAVARRYLDQGAKDNKTYRVPADGEKMPGYYQGNTQSSTVVRVIQGLGDPRYVRYSATARDGVSRLRKAPAVDRIKEYGLTAAVVGMVPFSTSSIIRLVQAAISHDWGGVAIESGTVLTDAVAMAGFRKLRQDEFRRNRGMGPVVQTKGGPPPRDAKPLPKTDEDWAALGLAPNDWENYPYDQPVVIKGRRGDVDLVVGMGSRVIAGLADPNV